jgi:squalene-associated FAD-dependent desaturase
VEQGGGLSAPRPDAIVVGAGVAGLAAAVALAQDGAKVTLLERRSFVGGRAYSYRHPALDETIDSQHVVLGCCTNIVELMGQAGAAESIRWYDELCFLEPGTSGLQPRASWMRPGRLPAPMHQALSFLRAPMLGLRDKVGIARGLTHFLRGYPQSDAESFAAWLKRTGQTERAVRHFWEPVVVGALNDGFERCSTKYAGKVFLESFLRSPEGGRLGIPARPLSEFFSPVVELARRLGVDVRMNAGVEEIARDADRRWRVKVGAEELHAGALVLAGDLRATSKLMAGFSDVLPPAHRDEAATDAAPGLDRGSGPQAARFVSAPITTIHLWFDREVANLDHAVLLDTRIQWIFSKSRIRRWEPARGSYLELVISASWAEIDMTREQILASAMRELELFFPAAREARLIKSAVLKEARATFSVTPGLDDYRPSQKTAYAGLFVAGDWTATEWPSTMEGAVRSGRLAAGEVVGDGGRFMAGELPPTGLMRWFSTHP